MGTALNKTLKDIVCKSKILSGFSAPFVPGWDCHGLPIELNVEKKIGKVGAKVDAATFRQACRDYAASQVALQKTDFQRMGVFADWQNPYLTMNFRYEANTVRALAKMIERGHLHKGEKPVHWCPLCASALAEAEVEYKDKTSCQIDVAFLALDPTALLNAFDLKTGPDALFVPIWTTYPMDVAANQAVAVHAELEYVLVQVEERAFVFAKALYESALARWGYSESKVLATTLGKRLEHLLLAHPFLRGRCR